MRLNIMNELVMREETDVLMGVYMKSRSEEEQKKKTEEKVSSSWSFHEIPLKSPVVISGTPAVLMTSQWHHHLAFLLVRFPSDLFYFNTVSCFLSGWRPRCQRAAVWSNVDWLRISWRTPSTAWRRPNSSWERTAERSAPSSSSSSSSSVCLSVCVSVWSR